MTGLKTYGTGMFAADNVILGAVTDNEGAVDQADFGMADGSASCPPDVIGTGHAIISGSVEVDQES